MRWLAPVALAVALAAAGGAKLAHREATAQGFELLEVPRARTLSVLVPTLELITAVLVVAVPRLGGALALLLLGGFTVFLAVRMRTHPGTPCLCFGGARSRPVGATQLVRNLVLMGLAVVTLALPLETIG